MEEFGLDTRGFSFLRCVMKTSSGQVMTEVDAVPGTDYTKQTIVSEQKRVSRSLCCVEDGLLLEEKVSLDMMFALLLQFFFQRIVISCH